MKAVVICRTRNEARNIARFCEAHSWADAVLIADGGSDDNTMDIAREFSNVQVSVFREKVWNGEYWRNPHGKHINSMIDWALSEGADWIIFDDADCVPTLDLQRDIRGLLEDTDKQIVLLYRLYVWGSGQYFPALNKPGQSLWGWHRDAGIRALDNDWSHDIPHTWQPEQELKLQHPHSCLHYFSPDEATVKRKMDFYSGSGEIPGVQHPLKGCGPVELLPDWAKWR